jgi:hypothetical protein
MLGEVLQQFELLEREVDDFATESDGVRRLIDGEFTIANLVRCAISGSLAQSFARKSDPRIYFCGTRDVENHVIDAPLGADGGQAAFGHDEQHRTVDPGGPNQSAQSAYSRQITTSVHEEDIGMRRFEQGGCFRREYAHPVLEETESRQNL